MASTSTGSIIEVNHHLIRIQGFDHAKLHDIVEFANDQIGMIVGITPEYAEAIYFSQEPLKIGDTCQNTGTSLRLRANFGHPGTVINPLGHRLLKHHIEPATNHHDFVNYHTDPQTPLLTVRDVITKQLETGVTIVDLTLPLAKGQRELIVGDRKTGKTSFLVATANYQATLGSKIIYAAIGKKSSDVLAIYHGLTEQAKENTIIVATTAQDPSSLITITPFTAMALAEYFKDQGEDVLVIMDDLSTHARYYREISLLAGKFPGRDSYPGDIFYVHARLLERAGVYKTKQGENKAITCLPVAETTESDLTDYIVSNLISITDGHLLFDANLAHLNRYPAIHPGLSVTRVGKQTQSPLARSLNRDLTSFLNKHEKLSDLAHFGGELSDDTQAQLQKGKLLIETLNQESIDSYPKNLQLVITLLVFYSHISKTEDLEKFKSSMNQKYIDSKEFKDAVNEIVTQSSLETVKPILEKNKHILLAQT